MSKENEAVADGAAQPSGDTAVPASKAEGSAEKSVLEMIEEGMSPPAPTEEAPAAEVTEPAAAEAPAAEPEAEVPAGSDEDGVIKAGEVKGLPEAAQKAVNERIHKINTRRKDAEAKAEEAGARATAAEQEAARLKDQIESGHVARAEQLGLDPEYVSKDEAKTVERFQNLRQWKKFCVRHRNGYEGDGSEKNPSMTPEQIAENEAQIEDELLQIAGTAQGIVSRVTKEMREDLEQGRKLRKENAKKVAAEPAAATRPATVKPNPQPPKLPGGGVAPARPPAASGARVESGFDAQEFKKEGAGRAAFEGQFRKIFGAK